MATSQTRGLPAVHGRSWGHPEHARSGRASVAFVATSGGMPDARSTGSARRCPMARTLGCDRGTRSLGFDLLQFQIRLLQGFVIEAEGALLLQPLPPQFGVGLHGLLKGQRLP